MTTVAPAYSGHIGTSNDPSAALDRYLADFEGALKRRVQAAIEEERRVLRAGLAALLGIPEEDNRGLFASFHQPGTGEQRANAPASPSFKSTFHASRDMSGGGSVGYQFGRSSSDWQRPLFEKPLISKWRSGDNVFRSELSPRRTDPLTSTAPSSFNVRRPLPNASTSAKEHLSSHGPLQPTQRTPMGFTSTSGQGPSSNHTQSEPMDSPRAATRNGSRNVPQERDGEIPKPTLESFTPEPRQSENFSSAPPYGSGTSASGMRHVGEREKALTALDRLEALSRMTSPGPSTTRPSEEMRESSGSSRWRAASSGAAHPRLGTMPGLTPPAKPDSGRADLGDCRNGSSDRSASPTLGRGGERDSCPQS